MKKLATAVLGLCLSGSVLAMSSAPPKTVKTDPIDAFNTSWAGKALDLQRKLDRYSPMKDNNIQGSHNTYNSEVYRDADSYIDPQQKHSIYDQLRIGARFIELDAHWTAHTHGWPWEWGNDLLLCHSGIGVEVGSLHLGCGLTDRRLSDGMNEVKNWLNDNPNEVIILYIEDHTDGKHSKLYNVINDRIGNKIYRSGGCKSIPDSLTKDTVLSAGKQVVFWNDGGCSSHTNLANTAFTGLGKIDRIWEDGTTLAAIGGLFNGGVDRIDSNDVREAFATGANIVNLDDLTYNDGRMEAGIWSWDNGEPNNWGNNEDCAMQWSNGRWNDAHCGNQYHFACKGVEGDWVISTYTGSWSEGEDACKILPGQYSFSVPTNSLDNEKLKDAKGGVKNAWLNHNDAASEGNWQVPH